MAMDRWDPFRDVLSLRDAVDRLFQQSFVRTGDLLSGGGSPVPVEVAEREDAFVVRAALPGVRPDDLRVTIQGDSLTLSGDFASKEEQRPNERWLVREMRSGSFQRTVRLPSPVDSQHAEAHCENGVVTLVLPKAAEARPRRIPISTGGTTGSAVGGSYGSGATGAVPTNAPATESDVAQGGRDRTAHGDRVTEESQESFPASDSPSWTPERT